MNLPSFMSTIVTVLSQERIRTGNRWPERGLRVLVWDYDNDGWLDIFATSYDRTLADVVAGFTGKENHSASNRLFRNIEGKRFADVTQEVGLNHCFSTMGSNFGDFDNDGFLDMYLGTGDPSYSMLVPNRMSETWAVKNLLKSQRHREPGICRKGMEPPAVTGTKMAR